MLIFNISSLHKPVLSPSSIFLLNNRPRLIVFTVALDCDGESKKARRCSSASSWCIYALKKDSEQFEVDQDKAREALKQLDQELESLSQKKITPPKKKDIVVSEANFPRADMREDMPELTGSFLSYSAFVLFAFTIFYNVLFYTVIQPSVDGPKPELFTTIREPYSKAPVSLQSTPIPEAIMEP